MEGFYCGTHVGIETLTLLAISIHFENCIIYNVTYINYVLCMHVHNYDVSL